MNAKDERGSYLVKMRCVVIKWVCVEGCTEAEARNNPWDFAIDEQEGDQEDWRVLAVEPNT